jgi:hypothetical protein
MSVLFFVYVMNSRCVKTVLFSTKSSRECPKAFGFSQERT